MAALTAVRAPKLPKTLPKPLPASAAKRMTDAELRAGEEREPWVIARDAAVLGLLYGSGLRISEALGLKRGDFAAGADALTVTGKGNKTRMVPLLPQVAKLIADYVALCPYDLPADGPLFVGSRGGPLSPRIVQLAMAACAARLACRTRRRRTRCAIPSPRISWRAAATCARSRSCSATPRSRPRRFTPRSMPSACSKSIAAPIRARNTTVVMRR